MPSPLAPGPPSPLQIDPMHSMLEHPGAGGLIAPTAAVGAEVAKIPKGMMEASEELRTTGEYDPKPGGEFILTMLGLGPLGAAGGIGEGPGWVDRLEKALKSGAVLPATVAAVLGSAVLYQSEPGRAQQ